jgi:protein DGCR14
MPPPPAPKRIKRPTVVLDEDTYTSAVSHIIRRDFFPGLEQTDAQREYLNALESKNNGWIREAGKKLTQVMTPLPAGQRRKKQSVGGNGDATPIGRGTSETPKVWGSDTPVSVVGTEAAEDEEEKKPEVDLNLSLGAFQVKYTSEDTESFSQIIDRTNAKRFEKNAWMRDGNRYASKQRIAQQKLIEANPDNTKSTALTLRPSEDLDARPAAPTTHKHTAFNTLMFAPDSIEDWQTTRAQHTETASLAPPKAVLYANTRLPDPSLKPPPRPASPTFSAVRDAVAGRPRLSASEGGFTGAETPRVNGYAFVPAMAEEDSDEEDAPTDLLSKFGLKGDKGTAYRMMESERRERLAHKMVDRIQEKRNNGTANSSSGVGSLAITNQNATPKFLSAPTPAQRLGMTPGAAGVGNGRKMGNLTPAAQKLFDRVGGSTPRNVGNGGFGGRSGLGKEWTPTPKVKRRA